MRWHPTIFAAVSFALLAVGAAHARGTFAPTPLPYSCDVVRGAFAVATREHLERLAKEMGVVVTPSQRREVRKCLASAGQ